MSSRTLGVRLAASDYRTFVEKAKRRGEKPSVYLRTIVLTDLDASGHEALHELVSLTHAEVERLRQELARLAVVLLCDAGKCKPSDAKAWALENLGHPISTTVR